MGLLPLESHGPVYKERRVFCTLQFEGFHRWVDAPEIYAYLSNLHRHVFHVRVEIRVTEDREVEIIDLKGAVARWIRHQQEALQEDVETWSCETWATEIFRRFSGQQLDVAYVEVSEDGENGAVVLG